MNEENDWEHNAEGDSVKGPVDCVYIKEVLVIKNENGKSPEPGVN